LKDCGMRLIRPDTISDLGFTNYDYG